MDISGQLGALSGTTMAYPLPNASSTAQPPSSPPPTTAQPTSPAVQADALAPALAIAPSPTPASVLAGTENLPANVRYAPSSPPHASGESRHFDRSA